MEFRNLRADEIDVRVSTVNNNGCSLLLYKDARCDMNILDETVGAENWQRSHELINGNLFCNVSIKCDGEWITKQDVGTESYTEKEKGQASDSFKRACFNWGLGRELYTAPFIWINKNNVNLQQGNNGKMTTYDKFAVQKIEIEDKKITKLSIINTKTGSICYRWTKDSKPVPEPQAAAPQTAAPQPCKCVKCGAEIKAMKNKGRLISPEEFAGSSGGLCLNCYKQRKEQQA